MWDQTSPLQSILTRDDASQTWEFLRRSYINETEKSLACWGAAENEGVFFVCFCCLCLFIFRVPFPLTVVLQQFGFSTEYLVSFCRYYIYIYIYIPDLPESKENLYHHDSNSNCEEVFKSIFTCCIKGFFFARYHISKDQVWHMISTMACVRCIERLHQNWMHDMFVQHLANALHVYKKICICVVALYICYASNVCVFRYAYIFISIYIYMYTKHIKYIYIYIYIVFVFTCVQINIS